MTTNGNVQALRAMIGRDAMKCANRIPFPIDEAFPESLADFRAYVVGVAEELQIPVESVALSALAFASIGALGKAEVAPGGRGERWREILAVWSMVLMHSGNRKSALFGELDAPIVEWESREAERLAPELARKAEEKRILEERLKVARRKAATSEETGTAVHLAAELAGFDELSVPMLLLTESTSEALAMQLQSNEGRALIASAEGDALDIVLGRYAESKANLGTMLAGHAGDTVNALRVGRDRVRIPKAMLSMALIVQPDVFHEALKSKAARGRGFLARFLVCAPSTALGFREIHPDPVDPELRARAWVRPVQTMLDWRMPTGGKPAVMRLDEGAQQHFCEFRRAIETRLSEADGDLGQRDCDRAWGSKLPGAIARIAGVMQCLVESSSGRMAPPALIEGGTMKAALNWVEWLIDANRHAERFALTCGDEADPDALIQTVAEHVWANGGEISVRQLHAKLRRRCENTEQTRAIVQRLVDSGEGYWKPQPSKPGRVSEIFRFRDADS